MKKIYLLFSILLCFLAMRSAAQITFTQPAPAVDGQPQTIRAIGETNAAHLDASSVSSSAIFHVHGDDENAVPEYFSINSFSVTPYGCAGSTATTITFTLTRNIVGNPSIATVQLPMELDFTSKMFNCNGTNGATPINYVAPFTAYPAGHTTFTSVAVSGTVLADNCPAGYIPLPLTYTVPAGHNTSTTSQLAADQAAQAYWNSSKQAAADAFGPFSARCQLIFVPPPSISFPVTNSSGNTLSMTFTRTDITGQANISQVISAHTNFTFSAIPIGTYTIIISPGGMPVNCNMLFNNGVSWTNAPGHTFTGMLIGTGTGKASSLNVAAP